MKDPVFYILGCGGHACVLRDLLRELGHEYIALVPPEQEADLTHEWPERINLVLGFAADLTARLKVAQNKFQRYNFPTLVHPTAHVAQSAALNFGTQIMAGAVIQSKAGIGQFAIVNTNASVDHDCRVGVGAHIAPGAVLCGDVRVGAETLIGANATVLPGRTIGERCVIGSGAVVTRDVPSGAKVKGNPARRCDVCAVCDGLGAKNSHNGMIFCDDCKGTGRIAA